MSSNDKSNERLLIRKNRLRLLHRGPGFERPRFFPWFLLFMGGNHFGPLEMKLTFVIAKQTNFLISLIRENDTTLHLEIN